jgi:hypothetical protein
MNERMLVLGRVVLFWSDKRVPHEVLPTTVDRFTVTVWYFDGVEKAQADEFARKAAAANADGGVGGDAADPAAEEERRRFLQEQDRIRAEIRKFEALAGAAGSAMVLAENGDGISTTPASESPLFADGAAAAADHPEGPITTVSASERGTPRAQDLGGVHHRLHPPVALGAVGGADTDLFELD